MADDHLGQGKKKKRKLPKKGMMLFRFLNKITNWITVDSLKLYDENSRMLRQSSESTVSFDEFVINYTPKKKSFEHDYMRDRLERKLIGHYSANRVLPYEAIRRQCVYTQYDDVMLLEKPEDLEVYDVQESEDMFCHFTEANTIPLQMEGGGMKRFPK
ncbi:hypothetical protein WDU94_008420 [Cyamophila willieti]